MVIPPELAELTVAQLTKVGADQQSNKQLAMHSPLGRILASLSGADGVDLEVAREAVLTSVAHDLETYLTALGIIALIGAVGILVLGALVTTNAVQTGRTPFFFLPQHFLIVNPLTAVGFAGLFYAAVAKRNQSDWHIRLQVCAFVMLMGPGFGRILPLPFMTPFAFEIASIAAIVFILAGMARDLMAMGRVHTAWWIGAAVLIGVLTLGRVLAFSPVGEAVYEMVAAGTVMEGVNGLTYPPPPPMP